MERAPDSRTPDTAEDRDAAADEPRAEPIMGAPDVAAGTSGDTTSWNPAQGDRSFGYGSGARPPTESESDAESGQGDLREDAR